MSKKKTVIKKNEFRRNKDTRHPAYIYAKIGHTYKFLGLTHSPITDNVKNIKLDKNPNPKDNRQAYVRSKLGKANQSRFKQKEKGWKLSKKDKDKIQPYLK